MAADSAGNDITEVGVPVTGFIGIGPLGTTLPDDDEGNTDPLTPALNVAIVKMGLLKADGGPLVTWAAQGDPIEFWQDGYELPTGDAEVLINFTLAEMLSDKARKLISGAAPDVNDMTIVDGGGHSTRYVVWIEEIYKNGQIRRRAIKSAGLRSITEDKNTRGEAQGAAVVMSVAYDTDIAGHFREWVVKPA